MELSSAKNICWIVFHMILIGALQIHFAKLTSTLRRAEFKGYYQRLVRETLEIRHGSNKWGWLGQGSARSLALVLVSAPVSYLE